jgi:hypothetical protein
MTVTNIIGSLSRRKVVIFMSMKRLLFILLLLPVFAYAQVNYVLPNETIIFSFESIKGKKMVLAKDKSDAYIIYRFGSKEKVEMEFPKKTKDSWKRFKYSYFLRGGGPDNSGIDLNYVFFDNDNIRYIIYDTYFSESRKYSIGVRVISLDKKITDIRGNYKTRKGSMVDFRDNGLLEIGDELFD